MDHPDHPQDQAPAPASKVPSLIHDYRAQRDAWREQARNLARMREEVLAAADREARDIVTTARADVRSILLKARRDLLVLAAQVRAAGRLGEAEDAPDTINFLPANDLGKASDALTTARHDVRRVLDESRPELEGLEAEGDALRAALRQRPIAPAAPVALPARRHVSAPPVVDVPDDRAGDASVDFEFASMGGDDEPDLMLRESPRLPVRAFIAAIATLGAIAVIGTGWWVLRTPSSSRATATESRTAAAPSVPAPTAKREANTVAPAAKTVVDSSVGDRRSPIPATRSPIPDPRSGVSLQLAARRPAWIRITADGRVTAEREFKPGETQLVRATREVSIRTGNAGAVTVAVGGRQAVALGREGEVVTRRFAVETPRVQQTPAPPPSKPALPNPSVPIARSTPPQVTPTTGTSPANTLALSTPSPRAIEQLPPAPPSPSFAPTVSPGAASPTSAAAAPPRPPAVLERPAATSAPPTTPASLQDSLTNSGSRWLDAYYRQDRATMAAISAQVSVQDDRPDKERLPRGLNAVRRTLDDVNFRVVGSEAMLTARMTERMDDTASAQMAQAVTFVHQMWSLRNGTWQLHTVRLMSASALSRALR